MWQKNQGIKWIDNFFITDLEYEAKSKVILNIYLFLHTISLEKAHFIWEIYDFSENVIWKQLSKHDLTARHVAW